MESINQYPQNPSLSPTDALVDETLRSDFNAAAQKCNWTWERYQQLLLKFGHLLEEERFSSSSSTCRTPLSSSNTLSQNVTTSVTIRGKVSPRVSIGPVISMENISYTPDNTKGNENTKIFHSLESHEKFPPPTAPLQHDDDYDDDDDDGPVVVAKRKKNASAPIYPPPVPSSTSTRSTGVVPTNTNRKVAVHAHHHDDEEEEEEEGDEDEEGTEMSLAELVRAARARAFGPNAGLPTSPYDIAKKQKSTSSAVPLHTTGENISNTLIHDDQQKDEKPSRSSEDDQEDDEKGDNATNQDSEEEDNEDEDDEYDFDDGFVVPDDEDEEDEDDDIEEEEEDDDDEEDSENENDTESSSQEEMSTNSTSISYTTHDTSTRNVALPGKKSTGSIKPPIHTPHRNTHHKNNILLLSPNAVRPKTNKSISTPAAIVVAGCSSKATPTPSIRRRAQQLCCPCKNPSCELRIMRDGNVDPTTNRIFIREEHDRGGAKAGSATKKRRQAQTPSLSSSSTTTTFRDASPAVGSLVSASLSTMHTDNIPTLPPVRYTFRNKKLKQELTNSLYAEYNRIVFDNKLPSDMVVKWDPRLRTTAGITHQQRTTALSVDANSTPTSASVFSSSGHRVVEKQRDARISLSIKVVDSPFRLAQTLLHEMCHAAQWLIDGVCKPPHGSAFLYWAKRASNAYPGRAVTVCHNYEISYKYSYMCVHCGAVIRRHSKSVSETDRCGRPGCFGTLLLQKSAAASGGGGAPQTPGGSGNISMNGFVSSSKATSAVSASPSVVGGRTPSEYQRFCADHRPAVVKANPTFTQPEVLRELARRWNEYKKAKVGVNTSSMKIQLLSTISNEGEEIEEGTMMMTKKNDDGAEEDGKKKRLDFSVQEIDEEDENNLMTALARSLEDQHII